ncbi:neprilysin-1-like isoform X1 [Amblyomma americanum]
MLGNAVRDLRLDALISVSAQLDYHNSERYILYIGQPSFGVETAVLRGRYRTPFFRILHRYKLYIYRCALLLGANVAAADIVNDIVSFEAKLAAISEPPTVVRNPQSVYNLMSLKMLEGAIPEIRWVYFLNIVLKDVGVSLDLDDHVVVMHPLYLKRLSRLLKEVPSSTVANYIGWRIVQTMGIHTMDRFRRSRFRFDRYRYLVQDIVELPRECVRLTSQMLFFAVGRLYFDRHISKPAERYRKVYDLAEEVRDAFAVLIDMNTWMDVETKDRARQKLHHLQLNIGYPPWIRSDRDLDEYYRDLTDLRKEEFFVSFLKVLLIHSRIGFSKLRNVRRAPDFGWYPGSIDGSTFYSHLGNYILLPVDYIQYPFFLLEMPPPINFGALGSIIGQEITHGFGEHGAMYDDRGKLVEWWSRQTHRKFITGSRCLLEQYDQFTNPVTGRKLNINGTLESNIADNAGLRQAFKAYRVYMIKYEELYGMYAIPGTEPYTMDQVFFIAYALSRCEVSRKRSMYSYLNPRETIPSRFRTIIPLMNFERFSEAFGCRVGTIMNPEQKCIVW